MASSPPAGSSLFDTRDGVPGLLSSFPLPPSYIPPTPSSAVFANSPLPSPFYPPLSRPPLSPLPPVPGPSPISEHDTLMFISASRSKRASKLSLASMSGSRLSHRDSTTSMGSCSPSPLSPLITPSDPTPLHTLHTYSSNGSLSVSLATSTGRMCFEKSPLLSIVPHIAEDSASEAQYDDEEDDQDDSMGDLTLTHIAIPDISPMPSAAPSSTGLSDTDDDGNVGLLPSFSRRPRQRPPLRRRRGSGVNDSITSIDLSPLVEEVSDFGTIPPSSPHTSALQLHKMYPHLRPEPVVHWTRPPTAVLNKDLPPLPLDGSGDDESVLELPVFEESASVATPTPASTDAFARRLKYESGESSHSSHPSRDSHHSQQSHHSQHSQHSSHSRHLSNSSASTSASASAFPPVPTFASTSTSRHSPKPLHHSPQPLHDDLYPASHDDSDLDTAPRRDEGASSPDISYIIATTPRHRSHKIRTRPSSGATSRSRSRPNSGGTTASASGSRSMPVPVPPLPCDEFGVRPKYRSHRRRPSDDDDEDEEDYGEVIERRGVGVMEDWRMLDREVEMRLERELDGFGSASEEEGAMSDGSTSSSLDLHTPLPNLMLRDGMLSPYSKLLPQSSRAPSPLDRRMSTVSHTESIMTKTGIFKDERDTPRRRVRHRDGKLLRGGIGLTTGLGWSDSEDEGAQSALTRRVSSQLLAKRASESSLASSVQGYGKASLARSVSDTLRSAASSLALHQQHQLEQQRKMKEKEARPSVPPTSWTRSSTATTSSARTSSASSASMFSHLSDRPEPPPLPSHVLEGIREQDSGEMEVDEFGALVHARTGSSALSSASASSASLPMPATPVGDEELGVAAWSKGVPAPTKMAAKRIASRGNLKGPTPLSLSFVKEREKQRERERESTVSASSRGSLQSPRTPVQARGTSSSLPSRAIAMPKTPSRTTSASGIATPSRRPIASTSAAAASSAPRPLRLTQSSILHDKPSALRTPVTRSTSTKTIASSTPSKSIATPTHASRRTASGSKMSAPPSSFARLSTMSQPASTSHIASISASAAHSSLPHPPPSMHPLPHMTPSPSRLARPVVHSEHASARPVPPGDRRPRTGTGMAYRTSAGGGLARPSLVRPPSSALLKGASTVAVGSRF